MVIPRRLHSGKDLLALETRARVNTSCTCRESSGRHPYSTLWTDFRVHTQHEVVDLTSVSAKPAGCQSPRTRLSGKMSHATLASLVPVNFHK